MTIYIIIFASRADIIAFMKLLSALAALILSAFFISPAETAYAAERYGVAGEGAHFCQSKSLDSSLFEIPPTYCAKILSEEDGWLRVLYAADDGLYAEVCGFVPADSLKVVETPPPTLYLYCPVTILFSADSGGRTPLQPKCVTAAYYGVYVDGGAKYSYVYDGEGFGYVKGDIGVYEPNTPAAPAVAITDGGKAINVRLIVALSLTAAAAIALVALYLVGRRRHIKK